MAHDTTLPEIESSIPWLNDRMAARLYSVLRLQSVVDITRKYLGEQATNIFGHLIPHQLSRAQDALKLSETASKHFHNQSAA